MVSHYIKELPLYLDELIAERSTRGLFLPDVKVCLRSFVPTFHSCKIS